MMRIRRTLAAVALASWACGSTQPDATPQVATVVVTPSSSTLALNAQLPLQAQVTDASGAIVPNASVVWTVKNPDVVSVSSAGVVTALAVGSTQVAANSFGEAGIATITVAQTPVASVVVVPARLDAGVGTKTQLTATALDASQKTLANRAMIWTTSNGSVATVDATGMVTTVGIGSATITATAEGKSGSSQVSVSAGAVASVVVTPNPVPLNFGDTQQLTVTVKDANGTLITGRSVSWATANSQVATVSGSGVVTATGPGSTSITGTVDGVSGSTRVDVTLIPVANVLVTPNPLNLQVGDAGQLTAVLTDASGATLTGRVVNWSSSDSSIATVSNGAVNAVKKGKATITAESGGVKGSAVVNVGPAPVKSVSVNPGTKTLVAGTSTQLTATVTDVNDATVSNPTVTWNTTDAQVAGVSGSGAVTTLKVGTATITATSDGVSGTARITVTPAAVAAVSVTPKLATLTKGQTVQLTATVFDKYGNVVPGAPVTWSVSSGRTASVSSTGKVTGKREGLVTVTATSSGKSDTALITVVD
jgi:trimeric autotransporter adhesin